MYSLIQIDKKAFIARINNLRKRPVVDTRYDVIDGTTKLILVYIDGSEEIFKGLRNAA